MGHRIQVLLASAAVCVALTGCSQMTQTTSGRDYLRAYSNEVGPKGQPMDDEIKRAAAVEPLLRFPARIGIARIGGGDRWRGPELTAVPANEAEAWLAAAKDLGPSFGEFVPISPLIAEMFDDRTGQNRSSEAREAVRKIRLAAARQHVDAVLIYESDGTANSSSNPLSIADWTLIGLFVVPGQDVDARGVAQAMLIDVRNGYPYGSAQAEATDSTITVRVATDDAKRGLAESARLSAVQKLVPEVEKMLRTLRLELAEKREAKRGR